MDVRDSVEGIEAMKFLQSGSETIFANGRILSIGRVRYLIFVASMIYRALFALALLLAGIDWLSGTTNVQDLILNSVALVMILEIDELVFHTLMPRKSQNFVADLQPVHVAESGRPG